MIAAPFPNECWEFSFSELMQTGIWPYSALSFRLAESHIVLETYNRSMLFLSIEISYVMLHGLEWSLTQMKCLWFVSWFGVYPKQHISEYVEVMQISEPHLHLWDRSLCNWINKLTVKKIWWIKIRKKRCILCHLLMRLQSNWIPKCLTAGANTLRR